MACLLSITARFQPADLLAIEVNVLYRFKGTGQGKLLCKDNKSRVESFYTLKRGLEVGGKRLGAVLVFANKGRPFGPTA